MELNPANELLTGTSNRSRFFLLAGIIFLFCGLYYDILYTKYNIFAKESAFAASLGGALPLVWQ